MSRSEVAVDRVPKVLAAMANALAETVEMASTGGRWTKRWDAIGVAQPHDPTSGGPHSGLNRLILVAAAQAAPWVETGAWTTDLNWLTAGRQVVLGSLGVVTLRTVNGHLEAKTLYNAGQVDGGDVGVSRFGFPPPFSAVQIDQLFGIAQGQPRSGISDPALRASQMSLSAVSRVGANRGYSATETGDQSEDGKATLATILGSQIVANSLGFKFYPPDPASQVANDWITRLTAPTGGQYAFDVTADASRLAAMVVEQMANRQRQRTHRPAPARTQMSPSANGSHQ